MKTAELTGAALDWAVAKCDGWKDWVAEDEAFTWGPNGWGCAGWLGLSTFKPSTDWAQGGPIIERERISVFDLPSGLSLTEHPTFKEGDLWEAEIIPNGEDSIRCCGQTPLAAAMRCYVASKLGDDVQIPEDLK